MTTGQEVQDRIMRLRDRIQELDEAYHVQDQPMVTDAEYDLLARELRDLEQSHPSLRDPGSPSDRVAGERIASFRSARHPEPMLSLANAFSEAEYGAWHTRVSRAAGTAFPALSLEPKIDGLAVRLRYERGKLTLAATRGDGITGEDVTHTVRTAGNLPLTIMDRNGNTPDILELRGEVYIPKTTFRRLNEERIEAGEEPYANPRNAAAGAVRQLDPAEAAARGLMVYIYGCQSAPGSSQSHFFTIEWLKELGFPVIPIMRYTESPTEALEYHQLIAGMRDSLEYEIDGIVIKVDNLPLRKRLGATGHEPRWATAWKFAAEQSATLLKEITVSIGRFGSLTPVAVLEPVTLAGVTVSSASLHNESDLAKKDIRPGDEVIVLRAGDVIPQVAGPVNTHPDRNTVRFKMPEHCPACEAKVQTLPGKVGHFCPNEECPGRNRERLQHFVSKRAMNVEHLGEHWCNELLDKGLVEDPSDLYRLSEEQLLRLDRMGETSARRILRSIAQSREAPLDRVLYSLGIHRLGRNVSGLLAELCDSVDQVCELDQEQLAAIPGIGPAIAKSVYLGLRSKRTETTITGLKAGAVRMERTPEEREVNMSNANTAKEHAFRGLNFVVTGKIEGMTRPEAESAIQQLGGMTQSSVTKSTNVLVVGEKPGSKLRKAEELGVTVMPEHEFRAALYA